MNNLQEHNPMHPGEFISGVYLEPFSITAKQLADALMMSPAIVSRLLNGKSSVTPAMALKLSSVIGRSPESWLLMQDQYDLYIERQKFEAHNYQKLKFA